MYQNTSHYHGSYNVSMSKKKSLTELKVVQKFSINKKYTYSKECINTSAQ